MKAAVHYRYKTMLGILFKIIVLMVLLGVLYYELFVRHDIIDLQGEFLASIGTAYGWVLVCLTVALMPLNWTLETVKWRSLVQIFQPMSKVAALRSVLAGVSMAIMTPGRIGEYGGRQIGIQADHRTDAVVANLISSLSQNIINIGVGLLAAILFFNTYIDIQASIFWTLIFMSVIVIGIMMMLFFRIDLLGGILAYLPDWSWVDGLRQSALHFAGVQKSKLYHILGVSAARYAVYVTQYVLLLYLFGVTDELIPAILGVATLFFLQSNLPLPPALSVLARGEMAIYLWSFFTANVLGIIAATFTLWLLNLVIPALVGGLVISQVKIFEED